MWKLHKIKYIYHGHTATQLFYVKYFVIILRREKFRILEKKMAIVVRV